jgi:hypothetical protein
MTPEENLRAAAEYLSEHGHHKGQYFADMGSGLLGGEDGMSFGDRVRYEGRPACAMGALLITADNNSVMTQAVRKLQQTIGDDGLSFNIPTWNDSPLTTGEDVILMIKKAAEL